MDLTLPRLFEQISEKFAEETAQYHKDPDGRFMTTSWAVLHREVENCAAALTCLGLKSGDRVGLISENRKQWLIADLAILSLGAADVPRGNDATVQELSYILGVTETRICFAENSLAAEKILSVVDRLPFLEILILLDPLTPRQEIQKLAGCHEILSWDEFLRKSGDFLDRNPGFLHREIEKGRPDDLATIIFTSGTTGEPKGVMLSHRNFLHQVVHVPERILVGPKDIWLCVLPVWHSFERIMQYVSLGQGSALAYSKPIGKVMMADFASLRPTWMASVPRIWEAIMEGILKHVKTQSALKQALFAFFMTVCGAFARSVGRWRGLVSWFSPRNRWVDAVVGFLGMLLLFPLHFLGDLLVFRGIRQRLGGRFRAGISGGGALPGEVDRFFQAAGILLLEGYGITETAPVLAVRDQRRPVPGTVGPVFPGTEISIRGPEGHVLGLGTKGIVHARGPQVMKGYFRKPELTAQVIDAEGWFNTGDLGMLDKKGNLKIVGRAKDTIVLLGGENVEPFPIEQKLKESPFIENVVVVGQDRKALGVLIVPRREALEDWARENGLTWQSGDDPEASPEIRGLFQREIARLVHRETGFKSFETIARFRLLKQSFETGKELSAKQEIKRHVIQELYSKQILELFS